MKCLSKYKWVKLYRAALPQGKGIMGYWARLAGRAAFRQGNVQYCGYTNTVTPGMWSGGIVGLKSILGVKRHSQALQIMNELQHLGYISYSLDMSDVVYNWRLKPFIERLAEYLEFSNDGIYCKERPGDKVKLEQDEIRKRLKEKGRVPVQKINVIRADTNYASNYVVCNRICQQMQIADLIVVDVSSENTNVFYEFGMAVALGKAILPICYSESFFEIQIPDKLKKFEERYNKLEQKEKKNHNDEVERLKRHIDCYPWRRNLFEHYGIRYRSAVDSTALNKDKIDVTDEP